MARERSRAKEHTAKREREGKRERGETERKRENGPEISRELRAADPIETRKRRGSRKSTED